MKFWTRKKRAIVSGAFDMFFHIDKWYQSLTETTANNKSFLILKWFFLLKLNNRTTIMHRTHNFIKYQKHCNTAALYASTNEIHAISWFASSSTFWLKTLNTTSISFLVLAFIVQCFWLFGTFCAKMEHIHKKKKIYMKNPNKSILKIAMDYPTVDERTE